MYSPAKLYACKFAEDGSMAKAIHWHTKAVEKVHSYSAYELGKIYLIGENNKLDLKNHIGITIRLQIWIIQRVRCLLKL